MKDYSEGRTQSTKLAQNIEKTQKKVSSKLILGILLAFAFGLFFVEQRIDYLRTEKRVRKLLIQKRDLELEILPLKLEEQYLTRFAKIEKTAKEQLHLREAGRRQVKKVIIDHQ